ncbi:MAG TPA: AAA family ATPase [Jatrophihabitans sp.]|nr:AAA family ATPase [Jatrophihabitans sp.]
MNRVASVQLHGLFGYVDHSIKFRSNAPTILTGPNGVGKTHLFILLRAALRLDIRALMKVQFASLTVNFTDHSELRLQRYKKEDSDEQVLLVQSFSRGIRIGEPIEVDPSSTDSEDSQLPPHIEELPDGRWFDSRLGHIVSRAQIERRYGRRQLDKQNPIFSSNRFLQNMLKGVTPILIDTKRLDSPSTARMDTAWRSERRPLPSTLPSRIAASRIEEYTDQIRLQIAEARRDSVAATQSADLSFAIRALAAANDRVDENDLREKYRRIINQFEELSSNALTTSEEPPDFPPRTTPTIRRILNVFLDDWEKRLKPLLPINKKVATLRRILDEKFAITGKTTRVTSDGRLIIQSINGPVRVSSLSSGEQHLIALFALLLFAAEEGSVVLIDEPELSMHAAWKHAFIADIMEVSDIARLQVVMATHSSAIINGRWDLVEELTVPVSSEPQSESSVDALSEDEDFLE